MEIKDIVKPIQDSYEVKTNEEGVGGMTKPTQKQIEEFWEWCGLEVRFELGICYLISDKSYQDLPLDLNNLFKYAVPKLNYKGFYINLDQTLFSTWHCRLWADNADVYGDGENNDPALSLFWAIYEVV